MTLHTGELIDFVKVAFCVDYLQDLTEHLLMKVDKLETDLKEMKQKLDRLEQLEANLLIGEIASRTEKEMVNYILKDCPDVDTSYITIHQLERTLYGRWSCLSINLSEDQTKNAKQNWDDLEKQLKPLPYNLYKIIGHFKADRNIYAHAKFDTQTVLHKNSLDQKVKDDCSQLLRIFRLSFRYIAGQMLVQLILLYWYFVLFSFCTVICVKFMT